jgi:hypothetical protein
MKLRICMFLFALGLGSSMAWAQPNLNTCLNQCTYDYNQCRADGGSSCGIIRNICVADCRRL